MEAPGGGRLCEAGGRLHQNING